MTGRHVTGTQVHVTPYGMLRSSITLTAGPTEAPEHDLNGFCWCQPLAERDDVTGGYLYIHRRSLDVPHIEREP